MKKELQEDANEQSKWTYRKNEEIMGLDSKLKEKIGRTSKRWISEVHKKD